MSRPWMPLYVADYLRDTRRLTTAEHGAYLLLIMEYWTAGSLPDDDGQLARIVGMSSSEWRKTRSAVQVFFQDGWKHCRIDDEIAKAEAKHERRSEAGKRGGMASANAKQNSSIASSIVQASSSQPHSEAKASAHVDPETDLFRRGREVLGKTAGGMIKQLLDAKGGKTNLARAAIETAAGKNDPREYIGAVIHNSQAPIDGADRRVDPRL